MKKKSPGQLARARRAGDRTFRNTAFSGGESLDLDLEDCTFDGCDFQNFEFVRANLGSSAFRSCRVSDFVAYECDLHDGFINNGQIIGAKFIECDLAEAKIGAHRLHSVLFENCDLRGAQFLASTFTSVVFDGCDLREAKIGLVDFLSCDLTELCRVVDQITCFSPCELNEKTVLKSIKAPRLSEFMVRCGIAPAFVESMIGCAQAIASEGKLMSTLQSTFISFGHPDLAFAESLHRALQHNGVQTFFFPEHAEPGKKLHRLMREGVNQYDRVVLVCSKASLDRLGVLNEIEETLARESRDGGADYLIPIRLDNYIFDGWNPTRKDVAQAVRDKVVADFSDPAKFDQSFQLLLRALTKVRP